MGREGVVSTVVDDADDRSIILRAAAMKDRLMSVKQGGIR